MTDSSAQAHTAGPWTVHGPGKLMPGFSDGVDYAVLDLEGEIIAEAIYRTGPQSTRPAEANARLISAAPELLEALEAVVASSPIEDGVLPMVLDALAKARGETA